MKNNSVFYQVSIADPVMHVFDVTLRFNSQSEHVFLSLPNWIPGSYMIRDFAMNITAISAKNKNNQTIKVTKIAKSAWKLSKCEGLVDVYYQVYAFDLSVRSAFLDPLRSECLRSYRGRLLLISADIFLIIKKTGDLVVGINFEVGWFLTPAYIHHIRAAWMKAAALRRV